MKRLSMQDLRDILLGAAIVGTGGGGSLENGIKLVEGSFNEGYQFYLAGLSEIEDEVLVGTPYGCGSISPLSEDQVEKYKNMYKIKYTAEMAAVNAIEEYLGEDLYGVVTTELGGGNMASALDVAARTGKPIIDADPAGRSVPCLQHSTYNLNGIPITPMGVADKLGDSMIFTEVESDERAEALARAAAVASFNHVGVVDHVARWKVIKNTLIKNTVTMCLEVGKIARIARNKNINFAYDIVEKFDGFIMFQGKVSKVCWEDKSGFTFGNIYIEGNGKYQNQNLRIWFQNENIISWKNGKVFVTVPDSINVVDNDKNMPLLNPYAKVGMEVTVFSLKAFEQWRSKRGLEIFGPEFFGYHVPYKKVEDILSLD
ncbi:DUF917 domain-containing protein [Clostridium sp. WLY-B-L2]|uniref:DUF917 domain-containing protein n=1 Tax=Clostridium aromativorans TaxID=2836848 RepID=A0ABS8N0N4_9CLOT|nr:DUF917 domain-containing protein [Clostridium aromativorans]MCC9293359.1 DUF917 domain-containing protein [Clostridium aromativorans]